MWKGRGKYDVTTLRILLYTQFEFGQHDLIIYSDDNIEVGADLYKIDTEAEATVSATDGASAPAASPPAAAAQEAPKAAAKAAAPAPVAAAAKSNTSHRTPSIHFLGKEGWAKRLSGVQTPKIVYIPPNYGRPAFTEEEYEALITGGANMAPEVKMHSSGAMFGY